MKLLVRLAIVLAIGLPLTAQLPRHRAAGRPSRLADVKRIIVVILENTDAAVAEKLPFMIRLAARGAVLANHHCIGHPSQPNYLALVSGSTHGVIGSEPQSIDGQHLGDLIEQRGLTWKLYAENYPGGCYLGETFGTIPEGQYVRRHVPFLSFLNVQQNFSRCIAHIVPAAAFDDDLARGTLPNFAIYIPDNQHNGHDSNALVADQWLGSRFGPTLDDPRFMDGTLFVVTYDESGSTNPNLRITTVLLGPMVRAGVSSFDPSNHYDLLRTIENLFGLPTLRQLDATAHSITGMWQ